MQLGMIGLGRMGANMVRRLMRGGHQCVVFTRNPDNVRLLAGEGAIGATSLDDFVNKLSKPRTAWVMVPAGDPSEQTVLALAERMEAGDIIIDGGNSYYKDDVRRAKVLKGKCIYYVDVGTSGGVWGLERGYCLMIGGESHLTPVFKTLAPGPGGISRTPGRENTDCTAEYGYLHCGPNGAGHFVKMIHNGIEYGLMQAYAEGFDILRNANTNDLPEDHRYDFKVADIAEVWRRGSVIGSWLLDLRQWLSLRTQPYQITLGMCRIPAKVAGQLWRLLKKQCRLMCSQHHYLRVFAHDRGTRMLKSCYRLCDKNLVDMLNGSRKGSMCSVVIIQCGKDEISN